MQTVSGVHLVLIFTALVSGLGAQTPAAGAPERTQANFTRVVGEVTGIEPGSRSITLKTDGGGAATVTLDDKTLYLRVPPGEKDLKKAVKIGLPEIGVGDRVLARFKVLPGEQPASSAPAVSVPAVSVMVMSKAELAQKHERDRAEWLKRGVVGTISALNPDTKQITVSVPSRVEGPRAIVVESADSAQYRRYAPDSVRFSDAKPSSYAELKVGDHIRVLGEKNSEGTRIKPEEIVSGSFRNVAGVVTTVNAAAGEVVIKDLQTNKPLTVRVNSQSMLRRMPEMMATMMARRRQAAEGGASQGSGSAPAAGAPAAASHGPRAGGGPGRASETGGRAGEVHEHTPGNGPPGGESQTSPPWRGGPAGAGAMGGDLQQMFERMPPLNLTDLKAGDAIINVDAFLACKREFSLR